MNIRIKNKAIVLSLLVFTTGLGMHAAQRTTTLCEAIKQCKIAFRSDAAPQDAEARALLENVAAVRALLATDAGRAQLEQRETYGGGNPLTVAAFIANPDVVKMLLECGSAIEAVDERGNTALVIASNFGCDDVVRVLLSHGANPDVEDGSGSAPLHSAALRGDGPIARLLLEAGAFVDALDQNAMTPLHTAVICDHGGDVIKLLLKYGADIDAQSCVEGTPLGFAAEKGNELEQLVNNRLRAIRVWAGYLQRHELLPDIVNGIILNKMVFTDKQRRRFENLVPTSDRTGNPRPCKRARGAAYT